MRLADLLGETLHSLASNKVRSGLTILGIVVGIASVIALMALGEGTQRSVTERFETIGSGTLTVRPSTPGQQGGGPRMAAGDVKSLTLADVDAIEALPSVAAVAPQVSTMAQFVAKSNNSSGQLIGVTPEYAAVNSLETTFGAFFAEDDVASYAKVCVLGSQLAEDLFGESVDPTGQRVRAGSTLLTVVGVLTSKGASGFGGTDSAALIPLTVEMRLGTGSEYLSSIQVQVADGYDVDAAETEITDALLSEHGIADSTLADFRVQNMADILDAVTSVTSTFTTLLAGIASISLLVGGIGIMNMMLTTVTERTREIGLRKAIGADEGAISAQFLAESVMLTLAGGAIGIATGWAIATFGGSALGLTAVVSAEAVALAAGVSAGIGVVFGFYPARRAARMSPIEALRYQ